MTRDGALGVVLLAVSAGYYTLARAIPPSDLADTVGPQGLPTGYAVVLAGLSLVLIARSWRGRTEGGPPLSSRVLRRMVGLLAIGVAYVALLPWVGYPLAIAGLIIGTSYYQGGRLDRRVVLVGVVGAAVLWLVFVQLLGIQHPSGVWADWLFGSA